mgnify:CR=1 FL=1
MSRFKKFKINWRYTIGEFLIIVFGIIAAFQVDTWKESYDNDKLLTEYLTDIEVGLQKDSLFYELAVKYFAQIEQEIDTTKYFLVQLENTLPPAGQKSLWDISDWYRLYISSAAFSDMNNSGRLNLIDNKELRYNLIAYYQYLDFIKLLDEEYNESLSRMQENLLTRWAFSEEKALKISEEDLVIVRNYLNQKQSYIRNYRKHRENCQGINKAVRQLIETELGESD